MLLNFDIFLNEFQETYQNWQQKKENHKHIELDDFSYVSPQIMSHGILMWYVTKKLDF